ncbi:DgyrCDS7049 [Dimorphilus gyrociliatus]|uniref:ATP synthase F1 subunit epsilon n=1 Tax=Dimorphilus gyrociliatus TaxID=2664684 RepID=A0A7I8VSJ6_9ANNE|nr:DgyrCDS7049 [Dimorphilus gyrociliatus]
MSGEWGSGSGRGGGGGGSVRDAGGSFGKMEAAHEEQYFRKMQQEQLKAIQASLHEEIEFSEKQISELQEEIARHKKKLSKLKDLKKDH